MDDRAAVPLPAGLSHRCRSTPALDWSAWNVQNDPAADTLTPPGTGGDPAQGFAKAVEMCNNNGHCRKFDAGTMCPSFRVTRDEQHLTRGRANTLRLALSGQLRRKTPPRPTSRGARPLRELQGLQARVPDRRRHGAHEDRVPPRVAEDARRRAAGAARRDLPQWAPWAARLPWLANLRDRCRDRTASRALARLLGAAPLAALAQRHVPGSPAGRRRRQRRRCGAVRRHVHQLSRAREPAGRAARAARRRLPRRGCAARQRARGPLCCGRTYLAAGLVDEARAEAQRMLDALAPHLARGAPVVGLEPSCLLSLRDEYLAHGAGRRRGAPRDSAPDRGIPRAEYEAGRLRLRLRVAAEARAAARPLPPEGVRRRGPAQTRC